MYFEDVFRKFAENEVRYVIAGGIAVNLLGVPRMTYDLDIIIDLVPGNIRGLFSALSDLKFRPKIPVAVDDFADGEKRKGFVIHKGMRVLSFWQDEVPVREVDVFVENPISFEELWGRRIMVNLGGGLSVPVISIDDLIAIKRLASRKQDVADIESLEKAKRIRDE